MSEEEKEKRGTVLIFPLVKKSPEGQVDPNEVSKETIDKMAKHYIEQLVLALKNHNLPLNSYSNQKDFNLVYESLKSAMLRSVGKHHNLQDYVDHVDFLEKQQ